MSEPIAELRVVVHRVRRADAGEIIAANRENVAYHAPWVSAATDRAAFDVWFARTVTGANVSLLARERTTNELVGIVSFSEIVMGVFRSAYTGYWGYARTGGRGLMTEALREAVRFAFGELGLHRVEANIQPENVRSITLARRAGFVKEGFSPKYLFIGGAWRDHERWAIVDDRDA
ncbi:MAG TPA: GNAT family N-acetyltransferase [Candidatus Limnocylindrales bacterium]|nr:GNAT family N-acetyltransferase [Candidatus Limnocylindrales bacterium]